MIVNKPQFDVEKIKRGDAVVVSFTTKEEQYPYKEEEHNYTSLIRSVTPLKIVVLYVTSSGKEHELVIDIEKVTSKYYQIMSMEEGRIWNL